MKQAVLSKVAEFNGLDGAPRVKVALADAVQIIIEAEPLAMCRFALAAFAGVGLHEQDAVYGSALATMCRNMDDQVASSFVSGSLVPCRVRGSSGGQGAVQPVSIDM